MHTNLHLHAFHYKTKKKLIHVPSYPKPTLTSRHHYKTRINYKRTMEQIESNQDAMQEDINTMQEKDEPIAGSHDGHV